MCRALTSRPPFSRAAEMPLQERLKAAFKHFDLDDSGYIEKAEFRSILMRATGTGSDMSEIEADGLLEWFDDDGDGRLSIEELAGAMSGFGYNENGAELTPDEVGEAFREDADDALRHGEAMLRPGLSLTGPVARPADGFDEGIEPKRLRTVLTGYLFTSTSGALNPPKFGDVLAGRWMEVEGERRIITAFTAMYCGPTDKPPTSLIDQPESIEMIKAVDEDYLTVSDVEDI